jgi:para-aminobenzoate synthetase/4-amino-4-deoxychorismate lyase
MYPQEVLPALRRVEEKLQTGHAAFGFLAYECAGAFGLPVHPVWKEESPLLCFGFYPRGSVQPKPLHQILPPPYVSPQVGPIQMQTPYSDYQRQIHTIHTQIEHGNTYQVNYTIRAAFSLRKQTGLQLFSALFQQHPMPYSAYLRIGNQEQVCLSPELFLHRQGSLLITKPMKGTRPRGRDLTEDREIVQELQTSAKDRAENIMITDMARHDLGQLCGYGTVQVPHLCAVETYRSVFQMTSTVQGQLQPTLSLPRILEATFPAASITGAPKRRTMAIIRDLEPAPRGLYTGSIGLLQSPNNFTFNVAIRTVHRSREQFTLGVGGGIVWDSTAENEYREIQTKMLFLSNPEPPFALFETLRLDPNGEYANLALHLRRLHDSALYWNFPFNPKQAKQALLKYRDTIHTRPHTVRIQVDAAGALELQNRGLTPIPTHVVIAISAQPVDSHNRFLYHKTTHRALYTQAREKSLGAGLFEVLFCNERGVVTEGTITSAFYQWEGTWYTPPLRDGLLPGIWRQQFMQAVQASERSISPADLRNAQSILLGNSVIGAVPVHHIIPEPFSH